MVIQQFEKSISLRSNREHSINITLERSVIGCPHAVPDNVHLSDQLVRVEHCNHFRDECPINFGQRRPLICFSQSRGIAYVNKYCGAFRVVAVSVGQLVAIRQTINLFKCPTWLVEYLTNSIGTLDVVIGFEVPVHTGFLSISDFCNDGKDHN